MTWFRVTRRLLSRGYVIFFWVRKTVLFLFPIFFLLSSYVFVENSYEPRRIVSDMSPDRGWFFDSASFLLGEMSRPNITMFYVKRGAIRFMIYRKISFDTLFTIRTCKKWCNWHLRPTVTITNNLVIHFHIIFSLDTLIETKISFKLYFYFYFEFHFDKKIPRNLSFLLMRHGIKILN